MAVRRIRFAFADVGSCGIVVPCLICGLQFARPCIAGEHDEEVHVDLLGRRALEVDLFRIFAFGEFPDIGEGRNFAARIVPDEQLVDVLMRQRDHVVLAHHFIHPLGDIVGEQRGLFAVLRKRSAVLHEYHGRGGRFVYGCSLCRNGLINIGIVEFGRGRIGRRQADLRPVLGDKPVHRIDDTGRVTIRDELAALFLRERDQFFVGHILCGSNFIGNRISLFITAAPAAGGEKADRRQHERRGEQYRQQLSHFS